MIRSNDFLSAFEKKDYPCGNSEQRDCPPWQPFPIDALPRAVQHFVRAVSEGMYCDPAMVAVPVLGALAGAIGGSRCLELRPGWQEPATLWVGLVAESGTMKSPVLSAVFKPFWDHLHSKEADHQSALEEHQRTVALLKRSQSSNRLPQAPHLDRNIVSDVTIPKLAEILSKNPRGLLAFFDELSGWFATKTRSARSEPELAFWLGLYSGAPVCFDRKTSPSNYVRRGFVSIVGGIQPEPLGRALNTKAQEIGLAARWLLAHPPRFRKQWSRQGIDPVAVSGWDRLINYLLELTMGEEDNSALIPMDPEAEEVWASWFNEHALRLHVATGVWASFLSKMEGVAARLALVCHIADLAAHRRDAPIPLPRWAMKSGIRLADWFIEERARIEELLARYHYKGSATSGNGPKLADRLGAALRAAAPSALKLTELHAATGRNYTSSEIRETLLDLEKRELAVITKDVDVRGRPLNRWRWREEGPTTGPACANPAGIERNGITPGMVDQGKSETIIHSSG